MTIILPEGVTWDEMSRMEQLSLLPDSEQDILLADMSEADLMADEMVLRPKQLAVVNSPLWITAYMGGRGSGKDVCVHTQIPTPSGWKKMGELVVGDEVFDEAGRPCRVLAVHDQFSTRTWMLHFSDGTSIVAGEDHQWVTWTQRDRKSLNRVEGGNVFPEDWPTWERSSYIDGKGFEREVDPPIGPKIRLTREIVDTLTSGERGDLNHCIPLTGPLDTNAANLPLDPWVLGYWLGNGSLKTAMITSGSKDGDFDADHVSACIASAGFDERRTDVPHKGQARHSIPGLREILRGMSLLGDKRVPDVYLRASIEQRVALLRGLCDSDGYADPIKGSVEFCSTSLPLAEGVLELARTLGEKPVLAEGRAMLDGVDHGTKYRVTWTPVRFNPFALGRKARNVDMAPRAQGLRLRHRMIVKAERTVDRPTRCITVDSPNSMYLVGDGMIPTHNTKTGARWTNKRAKEFPGCQIALLGRTVADVRDVMIQGEALALDTLVPTPDGFTTMGEIQVGDLVIGSSGAPVRVRWVSPIHEDRPCYKITFKDGESLIADANHKWLTWTHQARRFRGKGGKHQPAVVTTSTIFGTLQHRDQINHAVRNILPLDLPEADLPIPPYTLGVWLGDGHSSHAAITTMDPEVLTGISEDGFQTRKWASARDGGRASTYGVLGLSAQLKYAGLIRNKHVPIAYMRSSYQQRLDLLQGLIDTDGHVTDDGQVEFCNTNRQLALAVVELVASIGGRATMTSRLPVLQHHQTLYRVRFYADVPVARIARKRERIRRSLSPEHGYRYIKCIEPVPSTPVRCIAVDADDHLFAVGRTMVLTHNSGIISESDPDFMPVYTPSTRKLVWPNGSSAITYSSDSPNQLRGPQQHYLWADELAAFRMVPDNSGATAWDNAQFSTRLGDKPQILVTTTPKRVDVVREMFRQSKDKSSGVAMHIASTLSNRANLSVDYINSIYEKYAGTHLERQELHGELIGDSPGALWRSGDIVIGSPDSDADLMYIIGVDPAVTRFGDDTGIVVVAATKEPDILKRQAWVVADLTLNAGPEEWAPVVAQAQKEYSTPSSPAIVVVEGNQGGDLLNLVLNQLSPGIPIARVHAIRSKAARAEPIVLTYRQKRVKHMYDFPDLVDELTGWEPDVSKWSPGHLDALVWALYTLLVDPKPLWPFAPVLVGAMSSAPIRSAIPAHRRERGRGVGLTVAPWRNRGHGHFG